jgi:hypothetical protein
MAGAVSWVGVAGAAVIVGVAGAVVGAGEPVGVAATSVDGTVLVGIAATGAGAGLRVDVAAGIAGVTLLVCVAEGAGTNVGLLTRVGEIVSSSAGVTASGDGVRAGAVAVVVAASEMTLGCDGPLLHADSSNSTRKTSRGRGSR